MGGDATNADSLAPPVLVSSRAVRCVVPAARNHDLIVQRFCRPRPPAGCGLSTITRNTAGHLSNRQSNKRARRRCDRPVRPNPQYKTHASEITVLRYPWHPLFGHSLRVPVCPTEEWQVLIRDHHPGYITWEQYEHNQSMISANTHSIPNGAPKSGRGGQALLSGLLRCRRCGWMLQVHYTQRTRSNRYGCVRGRAQLGEHSCISFGVWRVDQAVAAEILRVINGNAVDAAIEAVEQMRRQEQEHRKTLELELEQARYEAALAALRYEAVDPDNRLVAAELEARWNKTLENVCVLERNLQTEARERGTAPIPDRELLMSLAHDLQDVWNSPAADMRLKQRIVRIVLQEIIADIDLGHEEIVLLLHWVGGRHSELRVRKNPTGQNRYRTAIEAFDVIRQMAGKFNDERIAATLNRIGLRTGAGNAWNEQRVNSFRYKHQLVPKEIEASDALTIDQAADRLGVSKTSVQRMIGRKLLAATQVIRFAPWEIRPEALDSAQVRRAVEAIKRRERFPRTEADNNQDDLFSIS
jgi:excisionase family DNA binding protein